MQTAVVESSGAANPRVPVLKLRVVSLSPTFAGRDLTWCRLKSHMAEELLFCERPNNPTPVAKNGLISQHAWLAKEGPTSRKRGSNAPYSHWLRLQLPRQSLLSHLGCEPEGGLHARGETPAAHLLFDLVRSADKGDGSASFPADSYMQLAVYDLLGALFAPPDPPDV